MFCACVNVAPPFCTFSSRTLSRVAARSQLSKDFAVMSAIWSKPKKARAVYERLQPAAASYLPANNLRIPAVVAKDDDELRAIRSSPYLSLTVDGCSSPVVPRSPLSPYLNHHSPPLEKTAFLAPPQSPLLQAGPSSSYFSFNGPPSTVSLLGEDDLPPSPSSAGLVKDWRALQVDQPHPLFCRSIF